MVEKFLLDGDIQPLEDDRAGERRRIAGRAEADFLAAQIFHRLDVGTRQNVNFRAVEAHQIGDAVLQVRDLQLRLVIFEDVRLREGDVDAAQIEEILDIGGSAIGEEGKDAQVVPVVQHFRDLRSEDRIEPAELTGRDADRPGVLAISN